MENQNNQQGELSYPENISEILSSVLQKYKLDEPEEEIIKKIETAQMFFGEIVMDLIRSLIFGRIQNTDLPFLLSQKLNIDQKTAENLTTDIKEKILPLIKMGNENLPAKEITQIDENNAMSSIKAPPIINVEEIKNISFKKLPETENINNNLKTIKKPVPPQRRSREKDNYREPIE